MVTASTLARAQAGDEQAFRELTDPYRAELQVHCYQILGSVADAEDMLQETLLAAWRGLQNSPPRQRPVLRLRDLLGYRAAAVAGMLASTETSVKGALQRARAALQAQLPAGRDRAPLPDSPRERQLAGRFAAAVEAGDV